VLKGGPVTPEEIVDAYLNANRALFKVQKTMSEDMKGATLLGLTEDQMYNEVLERVGAPNFGTLSDGIFRPMKVSRGSLIGFQEIADELGIPNPFDAAMDTIEELRATLSEYSLSNENIPNFENPFKNLPTPNLGSAAQGNIPTNVQNSTGFVGQSNITLPYNQLTQEQKLDRINELFNNG
jgi:hypothetical protein